MTDSAETPESEDSPPEPVENIAEQAEDLCHIHDHITRIIANLDINPDWFDGYDEPGRAKFELEPMVLTFLYMYARDLTQSKLEERLRGAAYVYIRFGLKRPLDQQLISHNERNRFDKDDRDILKEAAKQIQSVCKEHDVIRTNEPALEPDDIQGTEISEELIMESVERAAELGFDEFTADRASNAHYALRAYLERQGYLNMAKAGITTKSRRFARLSERDEVPHGSSHNRTIKKIADPESQLTFDEFVNGDPIPDWKRIRDEVLDPFHAGVEKILDELKGDDHDETAFREPVHAAIDITTWNFYGSPYMSEEQAREADRDPIPVEIDGEVKLIDPEHPDEVSGFKDSDERGYKFATITIVAENTPIVLGIEPVRDERRWEKEGDFDVETTSRAEVVQRLLDQASQHVDIHKIFLDREFDAMEVRDEIDRDEILYVIGKRRGANVDEDHIEEIKRDPVNDSRVVHGSLECNGREHDISFVYKPTDDDSYVELEFDEDDEELTVNVKSRESSKETDDDDDGYTIFTVNEHVGTDRAEALIGQYSQRMEIENEYKSIKAHFLPTSASKDYRVRFLYFALGALMYNVWRMANFILRDEVSVDVGEHPPILAGEIIELVAFCLFDPGG